MAAEAPGLIFAYKTKKKYQKKKEEGRKKEKGDTTQMSPLSGKEEKFSKTSRTNISLVRTESAASVAGEVSMWYTLYCGRQEGVKRLSMTVKSANQRFPPQYIIKPLHFIRL